MSIKVIDLDCDREYSTSTANIINLDADKIYVKDPRVKGGGYYRTVKGGSGKGKYTAGKYAKGVAKRGLQLGAGAVLASGLVAGARKIAKQEIDKDKQQGGSEIAKRKEARARGLEAMEKVGQQLRSQIADKIKNAPAPSGQDVQVGSDGRVKDPWGESPSKKKKNNIPDPWDD